MQITMQARPHNANMSIGRRSMILALPIIPSLVAAPIASAAMIPASKEVPNDESPFVQELLRRTREKADERYKERLADYNRRNFSDYFSFQAGNMRDLSPETQESIKKWLKENVEDRDTRKTAQSE